jgi:2-dehydropantoate 2-reductase
MTDRIAVMGAGAIGACIGAYLIREGHDITLIDPWAAHVEKMRQDGLTLTDLNGEFTVKPKALHISDVINIREAFDMVYLAMKSFDTRWATYLIEPFLKPTGFVLPAQNSLNDELVGSIVGFHRTVGCVPSISVGVYEPGHVIRTDPVNLPSFDVGELHGIVTSRVKSVVKALEAIGPSEATTNIWGARWSKLVINCMNNALAGLIGPALSSLNEAQQDLAFTIRVVTGLEVARVAQALGIALESVAGLPIEEFPRVSTSAEVQEIKRKLMAALASRRLTPEQVKKLGAPGRPSLLQDVMKGRHTEVDYLNGLAVKKGKEAGIPTPLNQAIVDLMHQVEAGTVKPDPSNLEKLKPYASV